MERKKFAESLMIVVGSRRDCGSSSREMVHLEIRHRERMIVRLCVKKGKDGRELIELCL